MGLAKRQLEMQFGRKRRYAFDQRVPARSNKGTVYDHLNESGTLQKRKADVLAYLELFDKATQQQFAKAHNLEINCVTAPFRELEQAGRIEKCGKVKGNKGYKNTLYRKI